VVADGGGFAIEDTGSSNGTYVDGRAVRREKPGERARPVAGVSFLVFARDGPDRVALRVDERESDRRAPRVDGEDRRHVTRSVVLARVSARSGPETRKQ